MYWGVYDNYTIRTLIPKGKKAFLVRALEPSYKERGIPYKIYTINQYENVLELYFDDIWEVTSNRAYDRFNLFNEDMAKELINFINKNEFDEINVHCSAGISRSSALMICISKIINKPEIEEEIINCESFIPNKLVLNVFDNVFNKEFKDINDNNFINTNKKVDDNNLDNLEVVKNEDGSISLKLG